jgi:hypothetical protein
VAEASKFYRHLFGGVRGYQAIFSGQRTEDGRLEDAESRYFEYPSGASEALQYAGEQAEKGRDVYHCSHLLTGKRRIKENASEVYTLWGELDGAGVPNGELKPTAVIESSPGRFHIYWRLSDAIPPEIAENLNRRLAREIGADPSGFDLSQLLRVPGTINYKYDGRPVVEIVSLDAGRSYSPAELDKMLPEIEESNQSGDRPPFSGEPPVQFNERGLRVWNGEDPKLKDSGELDRSGSLVKIGRVLYDAGANREVIERALEERDQTLGWNKYTQRRDAPARYSEIVDELERSGRNGHVAFSVGKATITVGGKKLRNDSEVVSTSANGGDAKPPVADRLVGYVRAARWPLFVDQHSESHTLVEGEAVPISRTNRLLTKLLFKHEEKAPSNDGLIGARRVLDMLAHDSGDVRELHTRAAFYEGVVFYQLAPDRVVRIDEKGWRLDPDPPVHFRAVKNLQPLPSPTPGGNLEEIAEWVNLKTDRDRRLFLAYVTLTALPHIPRPILQTTGVMGSGKSTACRVVKRLLDPTGNETVTVDRRDFLQKAAHCYVLLLDNQNSLPEWFQDTLCRLVTGESDSKRVLYSDDDDLVWSMRRAILLNGINPPSERGDVQDRTLPIELDRLDKRKRLPEDDFWLNFSLGRPRLLGAIFDALAGALRARHTVVLEERPRLTDWGLYAAALYESQGWGVEAFTADWRGVEETQQQGTLDGSIVAQAVILYMRDKPRVELSAAKLHAALRASAGEALDLDSDKSWPKTGRTLWKRLREVTPLLEVHGIRASRSTSTRAGRPIILDTEFTDGGGPGDGRTKNGNDNGNDKQAAGTINSDLSAPNTPHRYADGIDSIPGNDKSGLLSPSHTLIKQERIKEREGEGEAQGESKPDLSFPSFHRSDADAVSGVSGVSAVGKERPVSWDLGPGESATLKELQERRDEPPEEGDDDDLPNFGPSAHDRKLAERAAEAEWEGGY